ncbi:hypothetical protein AGMMS49546_14130 [Spirochaetia bacterium]|nr:hypothetical protein AGMMS49546_14130 [Spirochaetia bacterium]
MTAPSKVSTAAAPRASDIAYAGIKKAIIKRRFSPGERLGKRAMASLCGVSIIPVIDALNRLESEVIELIAKNLIMRKQ